MYGMVSKVLKKMIIEQYGEGAWSTIREGDTIPDDFNSFDQYDDNVTKDMVLGLADLSGKEATIVLDDFGQYWIPFAYSSEYSGVLKVFSSDPIKLLSSLDSLHTRLSMTFSNLAPPSFWISEHKEHSLKVHYQSHRTLPLEYFVMGLVKGIFKHFDKQCTIQMIQPREGEQEAIFFIEF